MTEANVVTAGVAGLAAHYADRQTSAAAATQIYLDRIEALNPKLGAFISVDPDDALQQAADSDARRRAGKSLGPLDGVPIAVKDNIDVAGQVTTAGIEVRRHRVAESNAGSVDALKNAGAVILGKTNMHEAALGGITDNAAYGRCHNPHRRDWTAGGSSGGSAAAVAAGLCAAALGTDTLGSVRIPSSYSGTFGHKPTYGLVSQHGVIPLSVLLDTVGPLARSAQDLRIVMEAIGRFDSADPYARRPPSNFTWTAGQESDLSGLTLARVRTENCFDVDLDILAARDTALKVMEDLGASVVTVTLDDYDPIAMRNEAVLLLQAEAFAYYRKELEQHPDKFTPLLRERLDYGANTSAPRLTEALKAMSATRLILRDLLKDADALVLPTTPHTAFDFENGISEHQTDFTALANFNGFPATAIPTGFAANGMPTSIQIVARPFLDDLTLQIAQAYHLASAINMWPKDFAP